MLWSSGRQSAQHTVEIFIHILNLKANHVTLRANPTKLTGNFIGDKDGESEGFTVGGLVGF